jgi:hypothetical protein
MRSNGTLAVGRLVSFSARPRDGVYGLCRRPEVDIACGETYELHTVRDLRVLTLKLGLGLRAQSG